MVRDKVFRGEGGRERKEEEGNKNLSEGVEQIFSDFTIFLANNTKQFHQGSGFGEVGGVVVSSSKRSSNVLFDQGRQRLNKKG